MRMRRNTTDQMRRRFKTGVTRSFRASSSAAIFALMLPALWEDSLSFPSSLTFAP